MLTFNFSPFPTLTTERLTLRPLRATDAPTLLEMRADPQVMQYIPRPPARSLEEVTEFIAAMSAGVEQNHFLNWAVAGRDDDVLRGTIGFYGLKPEHFRAEIGYMLHPRWQGQGLMQEALAAVLPFGFGPLGLHSVEGIIAPENVASARVLERAGFVQEGYFKESEFYDGRFRDIAYYALLTPDSRQG